VPRQVFRFAFPFGAAAALACAVWSGPSAASKASFDASRAFEHVRQLVAIGPRPPGSHGSLQARRYIRAQIEAAGLTSVEHPFTASTPLGRIDMANISVTIKGSRPERIVFGGHYDTKLFRRFRFVGANDGGSSTAMLLELARALKARSNPFTMEIVFFDGEEALVDWSGDDHTYGSRTYVEAARRAGTLKAIRAMILVDMVGERDLTIRREDQSTPWLTDLIWTAAARLGYSKQFMSESAYANDDHVPFLEAGIPAVDIIDLQPSYAAAGQIDPDSDTPWHSSADTIEVMSARSLQIVGDVVLSALPKIEARLRR
jgi:Zn-dependent M28 family amino/carboxypeptidase